MAKILIADDEPHIRLLLQQTLEEFEEKGVVLLTAKNGVEALETIKAEQPDIVFLDIMMPEMNGLDVCNKVKNELNLQDVYIIMLTARGQEDDMQQAKAVGADIYIMKPFSYEDIVEKTSMVLKSKLGDLW
ncbi:MAG: response regulator [Candidatus Magnetoovum sp. WYHC-5]|nr:response regulator [Candidatus Magnetoovum sp. WYHC-5]